MPEIALYLGGALLCGLIIGLLAGLAMRTQRENELHAQCDRQDQIIVALLNEINRLARRPIDLNGAPGIDDTGMR